MTADLHVRTLRADLDRKHRADAKLLASILAAHQAGLSDREIAKATGYSHPTIARAIAKADATR